MQSPRLTHQSLLRLCLILLIGFLCDSALKAQNTKLKWLDFEAALERAQEEQRVIMVDVWAPWCGWCKKMEKEVYPKLSDELSDQYILTRVNRDDKRNKINYMGRKLSPLQLAQQLKVEDVPGLVFLSPEGDYLFHLRGYTAPEQLRLILDQLNSGRDILSENRIN